MKKANYRITEVRSGVFSIRVASMDEQPGRLNSISCIVQITGIPPETEGRAITRLLQLYPNLSEPPAVIGWQELTTTTD